MTLATLRTSKWILRTALAGLFVAFCLLLASWQWQRSQDELAVERAALAEPIPVAEAVTAADSTIPLTSLGRQVVVSGEVSPDTVTLVRDRTNNAGKAGYWILAGVLTADNALVPVKLGWTAEADIPRIDDNLDVTGRLQPDENFYPDAETVAGKPLLTVTKPGLAAVWAGDVPEGATITPGFVSALSVSPTQPNLEMVTPLIGTDPDVGLPLRNVLYSLQWLVLAGFAIFMWIKWFREDVQEARAASVAEVENPPARVSLDA